MIAEVRRLDEMAFELPASDARFDELTERSESIRRQMFESRADSKAEAISQIRYIADELGQGCYCDRQEAGLRNAIEALELLT